MLTDVIAAVTALCRTVPGVQSAGEPEAQLAEDRMLLVYPRPGTMTPAQHTGRTGRPVVQGRDNVIIEFHWKGDESRIGDFLRDTFPMHEAMRDALWSDFHATKFSGTTTGLASIVTDEFGEMGWAKEPTWGFRFILDLMWTAEISAKVGGRT